MFDLLDPLMQADLVIAVQNRDFFPQEDRTRVNRRGHDVYGCTGQRQAIAQRITYRVSPAQDWKRSA